MGGKTRERRQCLHCHIIGYDRLCSSVIGSCDKSHPVFVRVPHSQTILNEQYNGVTGKTDLKKASKQ